MKSVVVGVIVKWSRSQKDRPNWYVPPGLDTSARYACQQIEKYLATSDGAVALATGVKLASRRILLQYFVRHSFVNPSGQIPLRWRNHFERDLGQSTNGRKRRCGCRTASTWGQWNDRQREILRQQTQTMVRQARSREFVLRTLRQVTQSSSRRSRCLNRYQNQEKGELNYDSRIRSKGQIKNIIGKIRDGLDALQSLDLLDQERVTSTLRSGQVRCVDGRNRSG